MTKHGELYAGPLNGGLREFCERRKSETGRIEMHPDVALKLLDEKEAAEARCAELEARVGELEAALKWAVPLAEIALDECRLERLRTGNRDIGKEEGHPGLWPIEVAAKTRARATLSGSPAPTEQQLQETQNRAQAASHEVDEMARIDPSDLHKPMGPSERSPAPVGEADQEAEILAAMEEGYREGIFGKAQLAERAVVEAAMNRRVALRNKHGVVSRDAQLKDACDNLAKLRETGGE